MKNTITSIGSTGYIGQKKKGEKIHKDKSLIDLIQIEQINSHLDQFIATPVQTEHNKSFHKVQDK